MRLVLLAALLLAALPGCGPDPKDHTPTKIETPPEERGGAK